MKEPRRLLSETGTSALERSLLGAGRARRERDGARERVWGAVAAGVAGGTMTAAVSGTAAAGVRAGASATHAGAGAGAATGAKAAGVTVALTKIKILVVGAVIASAGSASYVALRHEAAPGPAQRVEAARVSTAPSPVAPIAAPVVTTPIPLSGDANGTNNANVEPSGASKRAHANGLVEPRATARRPATTKAPPEDEAAHAVAVSDLRDEAAMLGEVRAALRRGDARAARTVLDDARTRFPASRLGQERDALEVRVTRASGDPARAASLARAFLERYPDSPLRGGVESIASLPEKE